MLHKHYLRTCRTLALILAAVLLLGAVPAAAAERTVTAFGIDVSVHQGTIDWDTVAPQIDFAIIRCGYGSDYTSQDDRQWQTNADACTRLGIPFGVYLYSYALTDESALSEAEHVLRLLEGYDPALPVYLDLEDSSISKNCSAEDILRHATIFCEAIEAAGYRAGIYANYYWWTTFLTAPEYDQWDRWLARYADEPDYEKEFSFWQYSSTGRISGIKGNVDLNRCYREINPFTDVAEGKYYYTPVLWAYNRNITTGTTATTFGSDEACTRAQVVTFLWRAFGCPEPVDTVSPFSDVKEGSYYYKAVLWAEQNKITSGTGDGIFSPDGICTRAQAATFLWRACGSPQPESTDTVFSDISADGYYYNAVLWAAENNITNGTTTTTFSPGELCIRAQAVTFLYNTSLVFDF